MSTKPSRNAPAPSRKQILEYLDKRGKPVPEHTLFQAFAVRKGTSRDEFLGRLERMKVDGRVLVDRRDRFFLPGRVDMVRGRVQGHPDGYGFLIPEHGGQDLFLSAKEMRKILHGDTVLAKVRRIDRRGRLEGTIVEVLERGNETVVGRLHIEDQLSFVVPDNPRIGQDIFVPEGARGEARHEHIVVVAITRQPDKRKQPVGRVVEIIGEHMEPGMEIEIAIRKYGIPHEWPEHLVREMDRVPGKVSPDEAGERLDLRALPLVTIDGEDAKDFDDAVAARRLNDESWELIVAIADVSHYVDNATGLDREAYLRGNSVYFPERVVPMLPEALSNGICSLNPGVDRLCFACIMQIGASGEMLEYRFEPGVMRSRARLTYAQVAAALLRRDREESDELMDLLPHLRDLHTLTRVLNRRRVENGTLELELPETRILFDEEKKIQRIEPVQRNDAHRLIEECMLAANLCAADFLSQSKGPGIYRVHEKPDGEKIEDARAFISEFGLSLGGGKEPTPKDFARIIEQCRGEPFSHIVQVTLLRSLKQAEYDVELSGHFALGFDRYTHFTSPIRRYPDLMVHRSIKHKIGRIKTMDMDHGGLGRIAEHCSVTERRADEATRDVIQWLKAEFMMDRVGEVFDGVVSGVAEFGVFVELSDLYVEGLVHVTALGEDYFHYDPRGRRLTGEHSGVVFQIGEQVRVRVVRVDIDQAKIDFELVDENSQQRGKRRRRKQGK
ncbi:MAG: Ribonuclease R [Gammaproteobacteria bacterium]|nr:Ribonuclease R [Gammaproteobacteria bacterium]